MSVERYLDVPLTPDSVAIRDLHERVAREADGRAISLTGDGDAGSLSGNLTPPMSGWLAAHIARPRQEALAAVERAAAHIKLPGGVEGICEVIEEDRLKRNRNHRRLDVTQKFYDTHHEKLQKLAESEHEYQRLKAHEGGRDARVPSFLAKFGIPALTMLPEFFMNYVSFLQLAGVPAIGFGLSIVVALAVAVASYVAGAYWKAYHFYMHPDDPVQRSKGVRRIGLASFLLTISLCAVGYARFHMVQGQVQAAIVIGMPPPNVIALTAGLLAGNILVFAVGAAITYLQHDENPAYAEHAENYFKKREEVEALKRKQLNAELNGVEGGYRRELKQMQQKARQMDSHPDNLRVTDMINAIHAKDNEVIGALAGYRELLTDRIGSRDPKFTFTGPVTHRFAAQNGGTISLNEFSALPLHLYRNT